MHHYIICSKGIIYLATPEMKDHNDDNGKTEAFMV